MVLANDKTFKDVVHGSNKYTFVEFYADWCRHCGKLSPVLDTVASMFGNEPQVQIVKVNGDKDGRKMSKKYVLQGYPTMMFFHGDNDPVEYNGGRDEISISNFIQQMSNIRLGGESEQADTISKLKRISDDTIEDQVLRSSSKTLVLFTSSHCKSCTRIRADFETLASWYARDKQVIQFAEIDLDKNSDKIQEQFSITSAPVILLFDPKNVNEEGLKAPQLYSGRFDVSAFNNYINGVTGIPRTNEGALTSEAGVLPELREKVRTLVSQNDKVAIGMSILSDIRAMTAELGSVDTRMLPYYQHLTIQAMNGNYDQFEAEFQRLESNVDSNEGIQLMLNVLKEFLS